MAVTRPIESCCFGCLFKRMLPFISVTVDVASARQVNFDRIATINKQEVNLSVEVKVDGSNSSSKCFSQMKQVIRPVGITKNDTVILQLPKSNGLCSGFTALGRLRRWKWL